jgi:hypothetical protein
MGDKRLRIDFGMRMETDGAMANCSNQLSQSLKIGLKTERVLRLPSTARLPWLRHPMSLAVGFDQ